MKGPRCQRNNSLAGQRLHFTRSPNVFVGAVTEAMVVTLAPRVHGAFFGQSDGKLTSALDFDDPVVVERLDPHRRLATIGPT